MRYLRLYLYFVRFSLSRALEFRVDLYFRVFMDLVYYAVNLAFFKVIFLHTPSLAGWSESQTMIFVSGFLIADAIMMVVVSANLWWLPSLINRGDLDYYLLRPVSTLFFVSLREVSATSLINLAMALSIFGWAMVEHAQPFTIWQVVLFMMALSAGTFISYLMYLLVILPSFWSHSANGLGELYHVAARFIERPDRIFTGWMRVVLTTILPFSLVASFPAKIMSGEFTWQIGLHFVAVIVALFAFCLWIWLKGLRNYSSASS